MAEKIVVNPPEMPKVYATPKDNATYIRTYKNIWVKGTDGKGHCKREKDSCETIARIGSASGVGALEFTPKFLEGHPEFKSFKVERIKLDEAEAARRRKRGGNGKDHFDFVFTHIEPGYTVRKDTIIRHLSVGATWSIWQMAHDSLLFEALDYCLGESKDKILSVAMFMLLEQSSPATSYARFARNTWLPSNKVMQPSDLTRLFQSIDESKVSFFFSHYFALLKEHHKLDLGKYVALDSTSISTYAKLQDARYGHNKQDEDLPQLNVVLFTEQQSGLPIWYSAYNGSIPDTATTQSILEMMLGFNAPEFTSVMDRGYYSRDRLDAFYRVGRGFLVSVPIENVGHFNEQIEQARQCFSEDDCYNEFCHEDVWSVTLQHEFTDAKGNQARAPLYVHIFHDEKRQVEIKSHAREMCARINAAKKEGRELTAQESSFARHNLVADKNGHYKLKSEYLKKLSNAGFLVLISNTVQDAVEAYQIYRDRKVVEECFKALKVKMNCKRFKVSCEESLVGKCFIQFVALALYMRVQRRLDNRRKSPALPQIEHNSASEFLKELQGVNVYEFDGVYRNPMQVSKKQRDYAEMMGVTAFPDDLDISKIDPQSCQSMEDDLPI